MQPERGLEDLRSMLDAPAPAVLLTYRGDGSADMSPVWFRVVGEAFEMVIAESDRKYEHLQRDRRAVLMVFEAVPPFRGVKIRAEVELDDEGGRGGAAGDLGALPRRGDGRGVRRGA